MKKSILVTFVMLLVLPGMANSQYIEEGGSNPTETPIYESGTTIGIGTTSPDTNYKLDVNGYFKASGIKTFVSSGADNLSVVMGGGSVAPGIEAGTVSGGYLTSVGYMGDYGTVGGGESNGSYAQYSTICGGGGQGANYNYIDADSEYGFIGGGVSNLLQGDADYSVIFGGYNNDLTAQTGHVADYAVIVGGYANQIMWSSNYSVIGGGAYNDTTYAPYSTVCGGYSNVASGTGATVSGYNNDATGNYSTAIGRSVDAAGTGSTAIGYYSYATQNYTCAMGFGAYADDAYSFVWSDGSLCYSDYTYQFKVCASNEAWFSDEVSALCFEDRPGGCSRSMGSYPDLETAYDAVMSMNPSSEDPSQLDYENLDPFISSEGPEGEISRNVSATVTAQIVVMKDLIARTAQLEQSAAGGQ